MKKSIYLLFLISINCFAQNNNFEITIKPEKKYSYTMNYTKNTEIRFVTDSLVLKDRYLKSDNKTTMTKVILTGKRNEDNTIDATITYGKIINSGLKSKSENPISEAIVKGKYIDNYRFKVESVKKDSIDGKSLNALKKNLEDENPEIYFPKKELKIGDSFEQLFPIEIRIGKNEYVNAILNKKFTLNAIANNKAIFELKHTVTMGINTINILGSGEGYGVVVYDVLESQVVKYSSSYTVNMKYIESKKITKNIVAKSSAVIMTTIEANL